MLRISRSAAAFAIAAVLTAGAARTAAAQKKVALFGIGGYYIASDLYVGVGANSSNKVLVDDSPTFGGRLVFFSQPRVGVELNYMHASSNVHTTNPSKPLSGDIRLDQLDISGLYAGYNGTGRGYVSLGLGTTAFTPHLQGVNGSAQWRFAWNVGAGFIFDVGQSLMARLDGRYRGTNTNRQTGSSSYCDAFGNCYGYASMVYSSGEVTAGLGIRF
ncbi:MAG TPA: outer membrane beta-barrel protein [Gemmatimonadales bacterium]|nr:outer membrane beta-barrel protein [Gemmatimonadales bacterium]